MVIPVYRCHRFIFDSWNLNASFFVFNVTAICPFFVPVFEAVLQPPLQKKATLFSVRKAWDVCALLLACDLIFCRAGQRINPFFVGVHCAVGPLLFVYVGPI